jgi:tRNA A-37 threonylcarbamoyl transferase component Bud32
MRDAKDTPRSLVKIGFDGKVHKYFKGYLATERFQQEYRVLKHLENQDCNFVPKVIESYPEQLYLITTNCGAKVQYITKAKMHEIYASLLPFGVRHEDPYLRNITLRQADGQFCIIDFEYATLLDQPELGPKLDPSQIDPDPDECYLS